MSLALPDNMPKTMAIALMTTDILFMTYWLLACLNLIGVISIPPEYMYADYDLPQVVAWNWSFFPLDVIFSLFGLAAVSSARKGNPIWRPLALISLVLTTVAGGMAIAYWIILKEFVPSWFLPNLALTIWPLFFIPKLVTSQKLSLNE